MLLLNTPSVFAQSGFTLSWDSEVGCLEYHDKREVPLEEIADDDCLLVCEGSVVTFNIDYWVQQVTEVSWETDGGEILSISNYDTTAEIRWPDAYDNGSVTVHITLSNGQEFSKSICVTTKPQPQGGFEIIGQQSGLVCSDSELHFDNQAYVPDGSQIVSTQWDFGDGTYSNEFNPSHSYQQEGTYEITLTVYDECGCSNIWKEFITVTKPGIKINCPTVACEGAMETYTLEGPDYVNGEVNCTNYNWTVDGGQIIQQGQDWIDVVWDDVDEDGFGYVHFDQSTCGLGCDNILTAKIPVVATQGTIKGGKTELCQDEQSRYALPRWPTTEVDWQVVNVNSPETPISGATVLVDQRNEISVDATVLAPGDYILRADYTNTLLQCGGNAEFQFSVLQDLEIDKVHSPTEICEGNSADFYLTQTIPGVTWSFSKDGQTVATVPGSGSLSHANYQFTEPGHYSVTAKADGYCTDYTEIDVIEIPDVTNAEIIGADEICPGVGEVYTFDGNTGGFEVHWSVDHGSFLGPNVGTAVTIDFDSGYDNYEISAQLINPNFNHCISDEVTYQVDKFEPNAQIAQTSGNPNAICTSSEESFELQGYAGMNNYQWSIEPEELANIADGQGTENVDILFNELYQGQTQGTIIVQAKVCGEMEEIAQYNFELNPTPVLTITDAPNDICPEEPFTIQVSSSDPFIPASAFTIDFDGVNDPMPNAIPTGQGIYEFQDITLPNSNPYEPINVSYTITASGSGLCGTAQVSGSIDRNPAPVIQISHTGANVFCKTQDINTVLTANLQGTGVQESDIKWFYSGNEIGTGAVLDLGTLSTGFGSYTAEATNTYDCTTVSNTFVVRQDCSDPIPSCDNEDTIVTGEWTDCNLIELKANYSGNPISVSFNKIAGFTADYAQALLPTDNNNTYIQEFETDASGNYMFSYIADYGNCMVAKLVEVQVDYEVIMDKKITCDGSNGYQVTILNQSTYVSGNSSIPNYTFKKLPGGQIIPPDYYNSNEAVATLEEGSYELTLTLNNPGKPTCEITETIHLQKPDATFNIPDEVCAEDPVTLEPDNPNSGETYLWEFQGATNTQQNISPNLNETNGLPTTIKLTVTDSYGCSETSTETIVINKADFGGSVEAHPGAVCEGEAVILSYNNSPSNVTYYWYNDSGNLGATTTHTFNLNNPDPGEYWVEIADNHGCMDRSVSSAFINRIQPPSLSAEITGSVCDGDDIDLTGNLSPSNAEYRIERKKNNGNYIEVQPWTTGPDIDYTDSNPEVGSYSYKVEYKDPETTCSEIQVFHSIVHPTPSVTVQMDQNIQCSPYAVNLTATGNQSGTYTWSNGMSGSSITVDHGGPYQVWFQPDGAECQATQIVDVPKSPEEYTWIFPTGCFEYCADRSGTEAYIIGPISVFYGGYDYILDLNTSISSGIGIVPPLQLADEQGALTLTLDNDFCDVTTDKLHLNTPQACERVCNIDFKIDDVLLIQNNPFVIFALEGGIQNNYNFDVSVNFYSADGVFSPGSAYIPANSVYDFAANNLTYIPNNPSNTIVNLEYTVTMHDKGNHEIICSDLFQFQTPAIQQTNQEHGNVEMSVTPNPVQTTTNVRYVVKNISRFNGGTIELYSLSGNLIQTRKVDVAEGTQTFDLSGLASGNYVLVFYHQQTRIGQQIIVKK